MGHQTQPHRKAEIFITETLGNGRAFNHEPDEGEVLANNLVLPHTSAATSNAVYCAEQI